jgi:hypothetical protein
MNGVTEGDFTMVFGYPGGTNQYVPSYHIEMVKDIINPPMIDCVAGRLRFYEDEMAKDPLIRIQYSSKSLVWPTHGRDGWGKFRDLIVWRLLQPRGSTKRNYRHGC